MTNLASWLLLTMASFSLTAVCILRTFAFSLGTELTSNTGQQRSNNLTAAGNPHVCTPFSCGSSPRSLCGSAPPWESPQPGRKRGALIQPVVDIYCYNDGDQTKNLKLSAQHCTVFGHPNETFRRL